MEPAQGNRKLMEMDAPPAASPVKLAQLHVKLSMLSKEACCYNVPYMNVTLGSYPMPVDEHSLTVTVDS